MTNILVIFNLMALWITIVFTVRFIVKWIKKQPKRKCGIVALVSFVMFWVIGFTIGATACDGEYIEISRTEASCTAPGKIVYKCDKCGETKTETIEPTGHSFVEVSRVEPTSDTAGKVVNCCENCGEEQVTALDKLPAAEPENTAKVEESSPTQEEPAETEEPDTTPVEPQETIDTSVSFADIYKEFKRNELNAKDLYNGNRYQITATINGMSTSGLLNLTGGATLTMESKVDNTIVFFTAEFERDQEEKLKQISVGDTITFNGTCYGGTFSDCELQ